MPNLHPQSTHRSHSYLILRLSSHIPINPHQIGQHVTVTLLAISHSLRSARKCLSAQIWSLEATSASVMPHSGPFLAPFRYDLNGVLKEYRAKSIVDTMSGDFTYEVLGLWEVSRFSTRGGGRCDTNGSGRDGSGENHTQDKGDDDDDGSTLIRSKRRGETCGRRNVPVNSSKDTENAQLGMDYTFAFDHDTPVTYPTHQSPSARSTPRHNHSRRGQHPIPVHPPLHKPKNQPPHPEPAPFPHAKYTYDNDFDPDNNNPANAATQFSLFQSSINDSPLDGMHNLENELRNITDMMRQPQAMLHVPASSKVSDYTDASSTTATSLFPRSRKPSEPYVYEIRSPLPQGSESLFKVGRKPRYASSSRSRKSGMSSRSTAVSGSQGKGLRFQKEYEAWIRMEERKNADKKHVEDWWLKGKLRKWLE